MGRMNISGRAIVVSGTLPYVIAEVGSPVPWYYNIWRVLGSTATRITDFQFGPPGDDSGNEPVLDNPRLSPDGNWIAIDVNFFDDAPFGSGLLTVPALGGTSTVIWEDAGDQDWLLHVNWNPDNDHIVFSYGPEIPSVDFGFGGSIFRVQRTNPGATPTELWRPALQLPVQREGAYRPQYSPDGTQIAFLVDVSSATGGGDLTRQGLWVMNADGTGDSLIRPFATGVGHGGYLFLGPQFGWSNDSEWIAYIAAGENGGNMSLYKIRPDGTDETLLATGNPLGSSSDTWYLGHDPWAADDSFIVASAMNSGVVRIYSVDSGGGGATQLVADPSGPSASAYFRCAHRNPHTNRIEWIETTSPGTVYSAAINGTDVTLEQDISVGGVGVDFNSGEGHIWI